MTCLTNWRNARPLPMAAEFPFDSCAIERREAGRGERPITVAEERRNDGVRPGQGGQRRRRVNPTTCERNYNNEEIDFMKAMDQYRRDNRRPFPTWSETLEVACRRSAIARSPSAARLPGLSSTSHPGMETL